MVMPTEDPKSEQFKAGEKISELAKHTANYMLDECKRLNPGVDMLDIVSTILRAQCLLMAVSIHTSAPRHPLGLAEIMSSHVREDIAKLDKVEAKQHGEEKI